MEVLNGMNEKACEEAIFACCSSAAFATGMSSQRPFSSNNNLFEKAVQVWLTLDQTEKMTAYRAHPRIGEKKDSGDKFAKWSAGEQSGVANTVSPEALKEANIRYEERFGFPFLISAAGKSGQEIYEELLRRSDRSIDEEMNEASMQQQKITQLRLEKLLTELNS